jgi:hypothetical protein
VGEAERAAEGVDEALPGAGEGVALVEALGKTVAVAGADAEGFREGASEALCSGDGEALCVGSEAALAAGDAEVEKVASGL